MNQWLLGIAGLVLCASGLTALWLGPAHHRGPRATKGAIAFMVLWHAGAFCLMGWFFSVVGAP